MFRLRLSLDWQGICSARVFSRCLSGGIFCRFFFSFRQGHTQFLQKLFKFFAAAVCKRNAAAVFIAAYLRFAANAGAKIHLQRLELRAFLSGGFGARLRSRVLLFPWQGVVPTPEGGCVFCFAHGQFVAQDALAQRFGSNGRINAQQAARVPLSLIHI